MYRILNETFDYRIERLRVNLYCVLKILYQFVIGMKWRFLLPSLWLQLLYQTEIVFAESLYICTWKNYSIETIRNIFCNIIFYVFSKNARSKRDCRKDKNSINMSVLFYARQVLGCFILDFQIILFCFCLLFEFCNFFE